MITRTPVVPAFAKCPRCLAPVESGEDIASIAETGACLACAEAEASRISGAWPTADTKPPPDFT